MTPTPTPPGDRGLQAERTSLAWRRTALSVAVGSLVGLRVLPPHLGASGYVACALGLVWSLDLALTSARRYRRADASVRGDDSPSGAASVAGPDIARVAAATVLVGLLALVCVVVIAVA